jgi:2-polyprenyl-3-methyl-5-hydroxy-6-metoxy-1,4-benzoquinol methylase
LGKDRVVQLLKLLKRPSWLARLILGKLDRQLGITEIGRASERGERLVIKDWESAKKSRHLVPLGHIQIYSWMEDKVAGLRCLDAGCGSGYGSFHLTRFASFIVGGDASVRAIKFATAHYRNANLAYLMFDVCHLPFVSKSFDLAMSFEILEHLTAQQQAGFLSELARVLSPEGSLHIGCPNAALLGDFVNPHHKDQLKPDQLEQLLHLYFHTVRMFGQEIIRQGVRLSANWKKYDLDLNYDEIRIVEDGWNAALGLLGICRRPVLT